MSLNYLRLTFPLQEVSCLNFRLRMMSSSRKESLHWSLAVGTSFSMTDESNTIIQSLRIVKTTPHLIIMRRGILRSFVSIKEQILSKLNSYSNVPPNILQLVDRRLLASNNHPLAILKNLIVRNLNQSKTQFTVFQDLSPVVSVKDNFDDLLIPADHVSRKKSESYYLNQKQLLRTHTTTHEIQAMRKGLQAFLIFADVYRRDQIDSTHYPAFHQMEAVKLFQNLSGSGSQAVIIDDLKSTIQNLAVSLFGNVQRRWVDTTFPFTNPSFQLEVYYEGNWLQLLGCGKLRQEVISKSGRNCQGWAAGLGLERFAMRLFNIPDIRLFWSRDQRFISQFSEGKITQFKPFSKYPSCFKDISFYVNGDFSQNDLYEFIRGKGGDFVENVRLIDQFEKNGLKSRCYRIKYNSFQKTLQNSFVNQLHQNVRDQIESELPVKLR